MDNPNYQIYNNEHLNKILNELEDMKIELSDEEEKALEEISKLKGSLKEHDLLNDFGKAALKGVEDYVNSFIDTSEIVNDLKNPEAIRARNDSEVKFRMPSADPNNPNPTRSMEEAKKTPYSANANRDNSDMTEIGRKRLEYYEEAYKERTKTLSDHSKSFAGKLTNNEKALSGIESFQFGPKVPLYSADEYKSMYEAAGKPDNTSNFIRNKNFQKYYSDTYKEFGFSSAAKFKLWCSNNKFTIHETPTGMYLVPTDVHASESHTGEVSQLQKFLRGDISKEELDKFEHNTKVAKVKYETATRAIRTGKVVAMGSAKILVQQLSSIIVTETYFEFKDKSDDPFTDRMTRLVHRCGEKIKQDVKPTMQKLTNGAVGNVATEIFTLLNDFIFKTAKNIFKVIRAMIGSIIRAIKVLLGKEYSWEEKVFEALKILSAGLVAALGFSLNEIISDFLSGTGIPPLVVIAPYVGDVMSGLIASTLSALVLMLFDSYKDSIEMRNAESKIALMNLQIAGYDICLAKIAEAQTTATMAETTTVVLSAMNSMAENAQQVDADLSSIETKLSEIKDEGSVIKDNISRIKAGNANTAEILKQLNKELGHE